MNKEILIAHGIEYDKGLTRFAGDAEIYEMVLANFLEDKCLEEAKIALANGDYEGLFSATHELKGSSGNCDMTRLFKASHELCELCRGTNYKGNEAVIAEKFPEFEEAYNQVIEGIKLSM